MAKVLNSKERLELITKKTRELRELVSTIDKRTAIPAFIVILYSTLMVPDYSFDILKSRVKQIAYLIRLFLSSGGHSEVSTNDVQEISILLNEIQDLYHTIHDDGEELVPGFLSNEQKKALVSQACYASNFYNTELLYQEQELDRIERVFGPFDQVIQEHEGFSIEQITMFYIDTNRLAFEKAEHGIKKILASKVETSHSIRFVTENNDEQFFMPLSVYHDYLISAKDYTLIDYTLAERLLKCFSISVESTEIEKELTYYCQYDNPLLDHPLVEIHEGQYLLLYNIQLAVAIYHYLESRDYIKKESLSRSKANAIESKSTELIKMLDTEGVVYKNYTVRPHGSEKDVLFISQGYAFIIECKSNKQKKYSKDREQSFNIIKQQFERSISEGVTQALEVECALKRGGIVPIYKKDSNTTIAEIDATQIQHIHILVVSQERYSLIQNNPALLLSDDVERMPSCFCIDDLETIILTFCRLKDPLQEFSNYLRLKEQLSPRLLYEDELDFAGKFLFDRANIECCLQDENLYTIYEPFNSYFDIMYNEFSLGFSKELNILGKLHISNRGVDLYKECKRIGMKLIPEVEEFCEKLINDSSNAS